MRFPHAAKKSLQGKPSAAQTHKATDFDKIVVAVQVRRAPQYRTVKWVIRCRKMPHPVQRGLVLRTTIFGVN